jgi:hypothetical protein
VSPYDSGVTAFFLSLILFQTIIPIALFISMEVCKSFQVSGLLRSRSRVCVLECHRVS